MNPSVTLASGISFPEGMIILVDSEKEPMPGNFVIAKLTDDNEATFKKLIVDAGIKYLKPLNAAYRLIELNGNYTILSVIVDSRWLQIDQPRTSITVKCDCRKNTKLHL
ncbi:putative prophage repressor protein [Yersinia aldovae]|nr:putative prophage repressor protein [Yersinia aldovae]